MTETNIIRQATVDGTTTVTLSGSLTIETSRELHRVLSEALNDSQRIELDLQRLDAIDLTALQIICSACKSASNLKRSLACSSGIPAPLASLGKSLGGPGGLPCIQNNNDPCIWFGGAIQCPS